MNRQLASTLVFRSSSRFLFLPVVRSFSIQISACSGHNKWSKIKDKKAAQDAQKSVLYTKVDREISIAIKSGGTADPDKNSALASVLKYAKEQDVPKENIERSLARVYAQHGKADGRKGERFTYEALAAGSSVGIIIECMSDNVNRTIHNVKEILTSHGARLAPVKFMFGRQGYITVSLRKSNDNFEDLMDLAFANHVTDFGSHKEMETEEKLYYWLCCKPDDFGKLEHAIKQNEELLTANIESAEIAYIPKENANVGEDVKDRVEDLVRQLEANDDTIRVWSSLNFKR